MKKLSTIGIIALVTTIVFAACTKNSSNLPTPNKNTMSTFAKKDTVTPPHLAPAIRDTVTPPLKNFNAAPAFKKDTVTPPAYSPAAKRDTVTPPKKGRNP